MIVELHLIQNFAPSNLNRDDTGAPKDCDFGGYRRARISSQCLKRSMRQQFEDLLPEDLKASRTKHLVNHLAQQLSEESKSAGSDYTPDDLKKAIELVIARGAVKFEKGKHSTLVFFGNQHIADFRRVLVDHLEELQALVKKNTKSPKLPKQIKEAVDALFAGGKAAAIALFGRMVATKEKEKEKLNVDAASQVAHAISTNRVDMEFDFYTAIDDLQPHDETGAGMMGTVEFNSSCFYRYANLNYAKLRENLGEDETLATQVAEAFLKAAIEAIPTGKQNSMAAQNPPDFIMAVVRQRGCRSLANAFVQPIRPDFQKSLVSKSIEALADYWDRLNSVYGDQMKMASCVSIDSSAELGSLKDHRKVTVKELLDNTLQSLCEQAEVTA